MTKKRLANDRDAEDGIALLRESLRRVARSVRSAITARASEKGAAAASGLIVGRPGSHRNGSPGDEDAPRAGVKPSGKVPGLTNAFEVGEDTH